MCVIPESLRQDYSGKLTLPHNLAFSGKFSHPLICIVGMSGAEENKDASQRGFIAQ